MKKRNFVVAVERLFSLKNFIWRGVFILSLCWKIGVRDIRSGAVEFDIVS